MIPRTDELIMGGEPAMVSLARKREGVDRIGYPRSWYLLCRSCDVRKGQIVSREFLGKSVVIFRGGDDAVHVLAAHCWHMGAHLGKGRIVGECIRCPLHHWEWDGAGVCRSQFG